MAVGSEEVEDCIRIVKAESWRLMAEVRKLNVEFESKVETSAELKTNEGSVGSKMSTM